MFFFTEIILAEHYFKVYHNGTTFRYYSEDFKTTTILGIDYNNSTNTYHIEIPSYINGRHVTKIGDKAFSGSGIMSVKFESDCSITHIGSSAFAGCRNLNEIHLPSSLLVIGDHAFSNCRHLTSISLPEGITSINEGITSINDYTFSYCDKLTDIDLPNSLVLIGRGAFEGCKSLKSITIPENVSAIGRDAFKCCYSLEEIYCKATTPPAIAYKIGEKDGYEYLDKGSFAYYYVNDYEWIKQLDYSRLKPTTLYIPCKLTSYLKYRFTEGWGKRIYIKSDELPDVKVGLFFRDIKSSQDLSIWKFYGIGGTIIIFVCIHLLPLFLMYGIFNLNDQDGTLWSLIVYVILIILYFVLPYLLF